MYMHTKFCTPNSNRPLAIAIKPEAKAKLSFSSSRDIFYSITKKEGYKYFSKICYRT
jgi:hypothetical protein